jgi:glutathionyl-hydroquinone reductase
MRAIFIKRDNRKDSQLPTHQGPLLRKPSTINPLGIVRVGPKLDFTLPHARL